MSQKGLTPLFIIILIALVIGGYLVYTNYLNNRNKNLSQQTKSTPIPTSQNESTSSAASGAPNGAAETANPDSIGANWKTYINTEYRFSFKYPEEKYLLKEDLTNKVSVSLQYCPSKKLEDCAFPADYFTLTIDKGALVSSLELWASSSEFSPLKKGNCYLDDQRTTVGGIRFNNRPSLAYSFIVDEKSTKGVCKDSVVEGGGEYYGVITSAGKDIFVLSTNFVSEERKNELNQILSTFRFD